MITVSTRGLKEYNKRPWGDEARKVMKNLPEKVRKVIVLPEDDLMDKEAERQVSFTESLEVGNSSLEGEPIKKVRKLEISRKIQVDEKVWKKDLKELEIDTTLKSENRVNDLVDRKLKRF